MRKNRTTKYLSRDPEPSGRPLLPKNKGVPSGTGKSNDFSEKRGDPGTGAACLVPGGSRELGSSPGWPRLTTGAHNPARGRPAPSHADDRQEEREHIHNRKPDNLPRIMDL